MLNLTSLKRQSGRGSRRRADGLGGRRYLSVVSGLLGVLRNTRRDPDPFHSAPRGPSLIICASTNYSAVESWSTSIPDSWQICFFSWDHAVEGSRIFKQVLLTVKVVLDIEADRPHCEQGSISDSVNDSFKAGQIYPASFR